MLTHRRGTDLKISIRLALASLGRDYNGVTKGKSIAELVAMVNELRREQIERGIIRKS